MVEQPLHVIDGQQVLPIHGDDDGVPDLGDEHLGLVLDLHVRGGKDLRVDPLGQTREDVSPGRPDGDAEVEGTGDGEDGVPDDVPEVGVQEEEDQVGEEHEAKQDLRLMGTEDALEDAVADALGDLHRRQDTDGVTEGEGQEEVGFDQLGGEDEDPEPKGHPHVVSLEARVARGEGLTGDVATRVLGQVAPEQAAEGHDGEEEEGGEGDEELNDGQDLADLAVLGALDAEDVDARADVDGEDGQQEEQTLGQMLGAGPTTRHVHPLHQGGQDHDEGSQGTAEGDGGPTGGGRGLIVALLLVVTGVEGGRVEGGVEPKDGDVDDPDAIEVDEHVKPGAGFLVGLEEHLGPGHVLELGEAFGRGYVHEAGLVLEDDALDALGVPEQLIDVVVADDLAVIALAAHVLAVVDLVALFAAVAVEGGDDVVQVGPLLDGLDPILAGGGVQVIVGALEDETEGLGHEPDLIGLAPAEEVEGHLSDAIVLRHAVHARLPAILGRLEAAVALEGLERLLDVGGLVAGRILLLLAGGLPGLAGTTGGLAELHVGEADGVIEIKVGGEVPLAVIGVLAADVVGVQGQQGLIGGHAGGAGIEQGHEMIEHVAHAVALEAELGRQVHEDVLDLLLGEGNLGLGGPGRVWFARPLTGR